MPDNYALEIPDDLRQALDAFEQPTFDTFVRENGRNVHGSLVRLVTTDAPVPARHRQRAVHGLGLLRDPQDTAVIAAALLRLDVLGLAAAADALGRIGTETAYELVEQLARNDSEHVRKFAVIALAASSIPSARSALRTVATTDPSEWIRDLATRLADDDSLGHGSKDRGP